MEWSAIAQPDGRLASPRGFEADPPVSPSSETVGQARKDKYLAEGADDENRPE
jgi:hypothetical protein